MQGTQRIRETRRMGSIRTRDQTTISEQEMREKKIREAANDLNDKLSI